ncbi:hypothetical protein CU098_000395, partial [Rhizopus stolonifer]
HVSLDTTRHIRLEPRETCTTPCLNPCCNSDQVCAEIECSACPTVHCANTEQLELKITSTIHDESYDKTALIAGLTTSLVVLAMIAATIVGFVFHKRRKIRKQQQEIEKQVNKDFIPPSFPPPVIPSSPTSFLPSLSETSRSSTIPSYWFYTQAMDFDHPQSPFIFGAHSLQIPHLDDTTTGQTIRRSLNIQPLQPMHYLSRASSVRITKYDHHRTNIPTNEEDDEELEEVATVKRAVSVRKNNSMGSRSSTTTRVGSVAEDIKMAKPTIARINTITTRNEEGGVTRKRSIRRISLSQDPPSPNNTTSSSNGSGRIDVYFCPPTEESMHSNQSQLSIQSNSTLGDGEITVYYKPSP